MIDMEHLPMCQIFFNKTTILTRFYCRALKQWLALKTGLRKWRWNQPILNRATHERMVIINKGFNGKLSDEHLDRELPEAQALIGCWHNTKRPHSALVYRLPAPQTILPKPCHIPYAVLQPYDMTSALKPNQWLTLELVPLYEAGQLNLVEE